MGDNSILVGGSIYVVDWSSYSKFLCSQAKLYDHFQVDEVFCGSTIKWSPFFCHSFVVQQREFDSYTVYLANIHTIEFKGPNYGG